MSRGELVRLRRCRLLLLAMAFGILLPIFQPSWTMLAVAAAGEVILGFAWWFGCRSAGGSASRSDPGDR